MEIRYCESRASYGQQVVLCTLPETHDGPHRNAFFRWPNGSQVARRDKTRWKLSDYERKALGVARRQRAAAARNDYYGEAAEHRDDIRFMQGYTADADDDL
jgi:hypothetical protein